MENVVHKLGYSSIKKKFNSSRWYKDSWKVGTYLLFCWQIFGKVCALLACQWSMFLSIVVVVTPSWRNKSDTFTTLLLTTQTENIRSGDLGHASNIYYIVCEGSNMRLKLVRKYKSDSQVCKTLFSVDYDY